MRTKTSVFIAAFILLGCSTTTAQRGELALNGKTVYYVMQSCKPSVKWDGMSVVLEGLQVPGEGNLAFSVGKIDYSEKAIRQISSTVAYFDGLLTATCQTLVRLNGQEAIERYSKHRDVLLSDLASTLGALEKAPTEAVAEDIAKQATADAQQESSAFYAENT